MPTQLGFINNHSVNRLAVTLVFIRGSKHGLLFLHLLRFLSCFSSISWFKKGCGVQLTLLT
jgi:hypothetical protein